MQLPHGAALSSCCLFVLSRDIIPVMIPTKSTGLLLDSRVVDVPMASNLIVVTLSSLKPFFSMAFNSEVRFSDHGGA
jgi:hypothetical protein